MRSQVSTFARNRAGDLIINPRKLDVQSFKLVPDAPNNPVAVAAGANSGPMTFTVGQAGPMEGFYLSHYREDATTAPYAMQIMVQIYDEGLKRYLMNREIHIDTLFGRSYFDAGPALIACAPHLFAETLFLHSSRTLVMQFRNAGAQNTTIYPVMTGTRFYNYSNPAKELAIAVERRAARARVSTPYWLTSDDDVAPAGGATVNAFFTVAAEGHFEWFKTSYVSDGDFTFEVFDPRNGRSMSNGPIHCQAGIGSAAFPFIEPESNLFQANGQIRVQFVDLSAAPNDIFFTMGGRRIYVA